MTQSLIHSDMSIAEILDLVPGSVDIMLDMGLHCVGCSANLFESLREGATSHGFTDEQLNILVDRINTFYASSNELSKKVPKASDFICEKIREGGKIYHRIAGLLFTDNAYKILHQHQNDFKGLRIKVESGGCSGYSYKYDYVQEPQEGEETFPLSDNLLIYMDHFSFDKLSESIVDFESGLHGSGLIFHNPNVKKSCHCGSSIGF